MKKLIVIVVLVLAATSSVVCQSAKIKAEDISILEGKLWTGTLTYLDYSSGKRTTINSNVVVTRASRDGRTWTFAYAYPDEPKADSSSTVVLGEDGKSFFGETVIDRAVLPDKTIRLVTTQPGKDNDRPATYRYTYLIGRSAFSIRKEVLIDGTKDWFERNIYSWTR